MLNVFYIFYYDFTRILYYLRLIFANNIKLKKKKSTHVR